jgi:hypothetical protein
MKEILKNAISNLVMEKINEAKMPPTESKGRYAVSSGEAKVKKLGATLTWGWPKQDGNGTIKKNGKEIGHVEGHRYFFDPEIISKHGFPRLTNFHMDT